MGGNHKGFHVAVLDADGLIVGPENVKTTGEVVVLLLDLMPSVIGIDSPCHAADQGQKSRACERELVTDVCGIRYTPDADTIISGGTYYEWIRNGLALYEALATVAPGPGWKVIEVFPTASWIRLYEPRGASTRAAWSRAASMFSSSQVVRLYASCRQTSRSGTRSILPIVGSWSISAGAGAGAVAVPSPPDPRPCCTASSLRRRTQRCASDHHPQRSAKNSGTTSTSSICRTVRRTPRSYSFNSSQSRSPSMRSTGGAPSRVASCFASPVKFPVVIRSPLSPRPLIAPRKSRTAPAPTLPL